MNDIYKMNRTQIKTIHGILKEREDIYIANINGMQIQNVELYCSSLEKAFGVPKSVHYQTYSGLQSCYEWMTYLYWLEEKGYNKFALFIYNYQLMMLLHKKEKKIALSLLENCINPEILGEDYPDKALPFNIYLETPFSGKTFSIEQAVKVYGEKASVWKR